MTDMYNQVYTSRPPIIGGLLYPGTYILAGAPKLGESFLMAQLAYHVSTGTDLWGFPVREGSVTALAKQIPYSASPISLAMRLNVCADRLKADYNIRYERFRSHKGRGVKLTLELHRNNGTESSNLVSA